MNQIVRKDGWSGCYFRPAAAGKELRRGEEVCSTPNLRSVGPVQVIMTDVKTARIACSLTRVKMAPRRTNTQLGHCETGGEVEGVSLNTAQRRLGCDYATRRQNKKERSRGCGKGSRSLYAKKRSKQRRELWEIVEVDHDARTVEQELDEAVEFQSNTTVVDGVHIGSVGDTRYYRDLVISLRVFGNKLDREDDYDQFFDDWDLCEPTEEEKRLHTLYPEAFADPSMTADIEHLERYDAYPEAFTSFGHMDDYVFDYYDDNDPHVYEEYDMGPDFYAHNELEDHANEYQYEDWPTAAVWSEIDQAEADAVTEEELDAMPIHQQGGPKGWRTEYA